MAGSQLEADGIFSFDDGYKWQGNKTTAVMPVQECLSLIATALLVYHRSYGRAAEVR